VLESHTSTSAAGDFAATDMLHRRVPLPHWFQFVMGESIVFIKTNSPLVDLALDSPVLSSSSIGEAGAEIWEIAVEVQNETASSLGWEEADGFEIHSFGPSRSLRMDSGSWFAHTPPSLSGVGFAMISGDESSQIRQLAGLLDKIVLFLGDGGSRSDSFRERGVSA
jgi:hypothetical protein